jgi:hypothetical protein
MEIGLNDYRQGIGGGQDGLDLLKAMQAGQITGRDTTGLSLTGEPLKAESLEKTLKSLEYRTQDIKLWNLIPKVVTYNTVAEYLQMASYGNTKAGFFYPEGALSNVNDSTYIRRAEHVKFMQTTGEVTMQAQATKSWVDIYQKEIENKSMLLARVADTFLTHGNADVVPLEFNSLYKQHAAIGSTSDFLYSSFESYYNSNVVVDMRGKSVKQGDIEDGAVRVDANFGTARQFCSTTSIISTISKDYYNVQRILLGGAFNGDSNSVIKKLSTTISDIDLISDKFMARNPSKNSGSISDTPQAPAAPTVSNVALVSDTKAKFATTDPGGFNNVFYAVTAINSQGESPLGIYSTAVLTAAGKSVDITFTAGAGAYAATGYVIYRTLPVATSSVTGLEFYPIFKVSTTDLANGYNGASAGSIRDCGYYLPNCEEALLIDFDVDVVSFNQLLPMSKVDLAILSLSRRFITFLWGTPIVYTPRKMVTYINCSKTYTT